jgi:glucosylglycerol 3-phosphatase
VIEGPGDVRDQTDPLKLNIVFPRGYQQYLQFFQQVANNRDY